MLSSTLFLLQTLLSLSHAQEVKIPQYCYITRADLPPAQSSASGGIIAQALEGAGGLLGMGAKSALERSYSSRSELEILYFKKNPLYAMPYMYSNLYGILFTGSFCEDKVYDPTLAGAINHFMISAFLTAQVGAEPACKMVMAHEQYSYSLESNSVMDMKNNLLGIEAGNAHRAEFRACYGLMVDLFEKLGREAPQQLLKNSEDPMAIFYIHEESLGLSYNDLARRFHLNPASPGPPNGDACLKTAKAIEKYLKRLVFFEESKCSKKFQTIPIPRRESGFEDEFKEYFEHLRSVQSFQ